MASAGWDSREKAPVLWEGDLNIWWLEGADASHLVQAGQQWQQTADELLWRETTLRMKACASLTLDSPPKFEILPHSPSLQQVPLASAPQHIQASAQT